VVRGMEPKIPARRWWELLQLQKQQASSGFDSPAATALTSGSIGLLDACPASTPSTAGIFCPAPGLLNPRGFISEQLLRNREYW